MEITNIISKQISKFKVTCYLCKKKMEVFKLIGLAVILMALMFIGLGFNIFFRKKKFPETEVGHNKEMRKRGIKCARTEEIHLWRKNKNLPLPDGCDTCGGVCSIMDEKEE
jgi:hypothetical protein